MAHIDIHSSREAAVDQAAGTGCACGGHDEELPELDVQTIPHAVRHAAIFGAIESLRPGAGIVLSATHNPVPLIDQLRDRHGDAYAVRYLDEGPERWRLLVRRQA
ncbi:hypothetical protein GCM10010922_19070 [Microbacterium sorbitolivorans]|uniref:DUF2249 domain-containing protein n=1 Tax=Microbacterium sorbitolivorans TaxID=1867410 RepID=A0A367Y8U0_9MICO|nr:DUF2249 domain-containing protein [Microbacterium sorbitolivorans]RCK62030.1 DUF2249 domain-containing protein [Microbacterium sorbitolivorans]GGF43725.1 hypothetical protein GCM10010922_19070 [Microbacterium sorbitolivorans]